MVDSREDYCQFGVNDNDTAVLDKYKDQLAMYLHNSDGSVIMCRLYVGFFGLNGTKIASVTTHNNSIISEAG